MPINDCFYKVCYKIFSKNKYFIVLLTKKGWNQKGLGNFQG